MLFRKMKILHIVAGLSKAGGGLSELVPAFAREAARLGHEVVLATVAREGDELSDATIRAVDSGVKLICFQPSFPRRLFFSVAMLLRLGRFVKDADMVHVHSNWTFPVWWASHLSLAFRKPLIMSPQGCLEPARRRRSAWKKRLVGGLFDRRYLRRASAIHATSAAEAEGIANYLFGSSECGILGCGGKLPNIAIVPNGIDLDDFMADSGATSQEERWPECAGKRMVLFLSRIHPLKGLDMLIAAWARVSPSSNGWHLLIGGPDEAGYERVVRAQVETAGLNECVTFCGPLYGNKRAQAMKAADLFVLPTYNENFGIAVAEALACGVPVITTKGAPWSELLGDPDSSLARYSDSALVDGDQRPDDGCQRFEMLSTNKRMNSCINELSSSGRCGWWIEIGVEPLVVALKEAMGLADEERKRMGENGRELVKAKYQWPRIAGEMEKVYKEVAG